MEGSDVGVRGNGSNMSRTNRPGKREREARNRRSRRCLISFGIDTPSGPKWVTVKLGRRKGKKIMHLEEKLRRIPVADVRELRREKSL
jgi:hypothetical protein